MFRSRIETLRDRAERVTQGQVAAAIVVAVAGLGLYGWWRERQRAAVADRMFRDLMGHGTEVHGPDPFIYLLYTAVAVAAVGGAYAVSRSRGREAEEQKESSVALELLPEDERRVVDPVVDSPGLTQVELRGRSSFSKSKVSQVVTTLEERGLLYREPQGRTYRVYPGELVKKAAKRPGARDVPDR